MAPRRNAAWIAPSLLSADFADLASAIRSAEAGGADALHLDVMDGHFVPNISFGPALVAAVRRRTKLPLDVHLMVAHPLSYVEAFRRAGSDTLVAHVESNDPVGEVVAATRKLGAHVGLALKPETPLARLLPWLDGLDELMVMGVHPGFSGQSFIPETLPKIAEARAEIDRRGLASVLAIDGGVTREVAGDIARAGATFFVCGNSVYGGGAPEENIRALRVAIEAGERHAVP